MSDRESALKVGIPIGAVYVGALASAALVSGSYARNYFAIYGVRGLLLPVFYVVFMSVFFYFGFEHVRYVNEARGEDKVYDYSSLASAMYGKYSKIFMPVYELWQLISMVITSAIVIATGSLIIAQYLKVSILTGAIILGAVNVVIAIFGANIIRKTSTLMSILIIFLLCVLVVIVMGNNGAAFINLIKINWKPAEANSFGVGIWRIFTLACAGSVWSLGLGAVAQKMITKKHSFAAAISAGAGGALIFLLSTLIIMPFYPDVLSSSMPIATAIQDYLKTDIPWLPTFYNVLMIFALVSSGAPSLFVFSNRFKKVIPAVGALKNERVVNIILGIIFEILCIGISLFGLTTIVSQFLQYLGYIAMPLGIIPLLIIWPILRKRGVIPKVYLKNS